jgi:hypothetical protein
VDDDKIDDAKQYIYFAGNFDCHGYAAVQSGAHCPMEHIPSFNRSHWMLPSSECLGGIAPAAAIVNGFK